MVDMTQVADRKLGRNVLDNASTVAWAIGTFDNQTKKKKTYLPIS